MLIKVTPKREFDVDLADGALDGHDFAEVLRGVGRRNDCLGEGGRGRRDEQKGKN